MGKNSRKPQLVKVGVSRIVRLIVVLLLTLISFIAYNDGSIMITLIAVLLTFLALRWLIAGPRVIGVADADGKNVKLLPYKIDDDDDDEDNNNDERITRAASLKSGAISVYSKRKRICTINASGKLKGWGKDFIVTLDGRTVIVYDLEGDELMTHELDDGERLMSVKNDLIKIKKDTGGSYSITREGSVYV